MNTESIYDLNKWAMVDGIFHDPEDNPATTTVCDEAGRTVALVVYFRGAIPSCPSSEERGVFNEIVRGGKRVLIVECYVSADATRFNEFSIIEFLGSNEHKSWFQRHLDKGTFKEYCRVFDSLTTSKSTYKRYNEGIVNYTFGVTDLETRPCLS